MGLPIDKIIVATNKNDILNRVFKTGVYRSNSVRKTLSPSMDIQVASNFERLLFDLLNNDTKEVGKRMKHFSNKGYFKLEQRIISLISRDFDSGAVTDNGTIATINHFFNEKEIILCPHSAIGVKVGKTFVDRGETVVSLGTAHPAKFKETVENALDKRIQIPSALKRVMENKESVKVIPSSKEKVADEIRKSYLRTD